MATASLTIDLDAIAANWRALDQLSGATVQTGAVVKADAYGLARPALCARWRRPRAAVLCRCGPRKVPSYGRRLAPRAAGQRPVRPYAGDTEMISDLDLTPMLNSLEQITRHLEACLASPLACRLDTGMNRLGVEMLEWQAVAPILLEAGPVMLLSHLACADEPDHPMNLTQLAQFHEMTDGTGVPRSFAATGGILLGPQYHFDLTRPGIGLYGGRPFETAEPVVRLPLPVIQTREVGVGETVGYACAWEAEAPSVIATVQGGYADGLLRSLSGNAVLWDGDIPCPVVGRISMDMITVDITHLRENAEGC